MILSVSISVTDQFYWSKRIRKSVKQRTRKDKIKKKDKIVDVMLNKDKNLRQN